MSKQLIRKQTSNFLSSTFNNNSGFSLNSQTDLLTGASDTRLSGTQFEVNSTTDSPELTGATNALLPMTISTVGEGSGYTTKRITFTLLINPETWNHSKTNSSQLSYTRGGWVVQPWGPNQDTISSTGKTAGFMSPATGYANGFNEMSFGYLNNLALMSAYKNNGYEYQDIFKMAEATRVINKIRGVQISYDNNTYMGHFNNFTLDEDELLPFMYNYNFEFIISALDGSEYEIRGHYQKLPESELDLVLGTEADPSINGLVDDVPVNPGGSPPKITDDGTTLRLWEKITGLPFSYALNNGFTNGSFDKNLKLRQQLVSKTWDKNSNSFV